jgi:hypothetical protein
MKDLDDARRKLIDDHFTKMLDLNDTILNHVDNAMRNSQASGKGEVSIFHKIKGAFSFKRDKILNIPPEDMLDYSKDYLKLAKRNFDTIIQSSDMDHTELLKDINHQIDLAQNELELIEKELAGVKDEPKKTWLQRKKQDMVDRSW